jgi:hypothetical protein
LARGIRGWWRLSEALSSCQRISIPALTKQSGLVPQLFDRNEDPYTITNLFDADFLQDLLIALYQIISVEVICPE